MRGYGFPEKDAWCWSPKCGEGMSTIKGRKWVKRYLHKSARTQAKSELRKMQEEQEV